MLDEQQLQTVIVTVTVIFKAKRQLEINVQYNGEEQQETVTL